MSIVRRSGTLLACLLAVAVFPTDPASAQSVLGNPQTLTGGEEVSTRVLAAGDANGDGTQDVTWLLDNTLRMASGTGTGNFSAPMTIPSGLPSGELGPELASADLNADGLLDVVVGPADGAFIGIVGLGNAATGYDIQTIALERAWGSWPFLADADDDGDLDIYLTRRGLTLFQNDGAAAFTLVDDFDGAVTQERNSIGVGDLDGDGRADLVMPAIDGDHPGLDIAYIGARPVTGLPGITSISVQPSLLQPGYVVRLADLENDGDLDIVLHGRSTVAEGAVIQVLRNEGARTFSELPPVKTLDRTGDLSVDMLLTDLDQDGLLDAVLGCAEEACRTVLVHHGEGLGALGPKQSVPVLGAVRRLEAIDVDCDGDPDIVGGANDDGVMVVLNYGARTYEDQAYPFVAGYDIAAAAVNGDSAPDLLGFDSVGVDVSLGMGCGVGPIQACTLSPPAANAGDDIVACGQPGERQQIELSGLLSAGGRPLARFCWETTNGLFSQSGDVVYCAQGPSATLELPTVAGREEATVTLTVTDFQGCSDSDTAVVATESEPVVQEARASSATACQGDFVSFIGRAADIFSPILTYGWDFDISEDTDGDNDPGNDIDASVDAVSGGLGVVAHQYLTPGDRIARMIVLGNGECLATADVPIRIVSAPRITSVSGAGLTCPGRSGSFSVGQTGGTQPLLYSWDFDTAVDTDGNGNPADDSEAVERNPTHAYDTPGEKTVRVTVLGAGGCSDSREIRVIVAEPPAGDFRVASPVCGTTVVSFEDDSEGPPPLTATWDFGDGSPLIAGLTATHVFPGPGSYTVTETVRDGNGCTTRVLKTVTIADVDLNLISTQIFDGQDGTDSEGNANGFGEPGETIQLAFSARNEGNDTVTDLVGRVSVVSPLSGVTIVDGAADFPSINGGGTASSISPHLRLRLDETLSCGTSVLLDVELLGFGSDACADSQRVSLTVGLPALTLHASEAPVTESGGRSLTPSAAYGEDHHATVFTDDSSGVPQVFFVRHLFDGPRVLPAVLLSESGMAATAPRLVWNPTQREFGVTWRRVRPDGDSRVVFARVTKTGQVIGETVELGDTEVGEPDVTWTGSEWVVAWPSGPEWTLNAIKARMLDALARPISPVLDVSDDGLDHENVRLQSTGGTWQAAFTGREGDSGPVGLQVRTFVTGATDELIAIADRLIAGVREEPAGSAVLAGRYLLSWSTAGQTVQVMMLDAGGSVLTQEAAGSGIQPAIAAGPDFAVLAYSLNGEVFTRGIAQTGALFSRVVTLSGGVGTSDRPTISASPQGLFMVLWQDSRRLEQTSDEIYGAVIVPVGDPNCTVSGLGDLSPQPNGDGVVNVGDVVLLLRVAVGLEPITPELLLRGDVAPGIREGNLHRVIGDGEINVGDVIVLLDVSVGNIRLTPTASP
jgi:PKD repeat protein